MRHLKPRLFMHGGYWAVKSHLPYDALTLREQSYYVAAFTWARKQNKCLQATPKAR